MGGANAGGAGLAQELLKVKRRRREIKIHVLMISVFPLPPFNDRQHCALMVGNN